MMKKILAAIACLSIILVTIRLEAQPVQIDYSNFNGGTLGGWITVNGTYTNKWTVGSATGYNLSSGAYISISSLSGSTSPTVYVSDR